MLQNELYSQEKIIVESDEDTQEVIEKLSNIGNDELKNVDEFETRQIDDELLNTQALGMIYWGLSKLRPNQKLKFHSKTEFFLNDALHILQNNPKELTLEQPMEVFDQIIQTCAVMLYSQSYLSNVTP